MKLSKKFSVLLFLSIALLLTTCTGMPRNAMGNLGNPTDLVPFMQNVRTGALPSGLKYFILENSKPENRSFLTLAVRAGSVDEEDNERGLAHFVEHMAFNDTERFPELELVDYLRSLGMRFGPEINAYTSFDRTVYGIEAPVETINGVRRIPDKALAIIDDWTRALTFVPDAVEKERLVIMEEYRMRNGAGYRLVQHLLATLLRGSAYAERLPIGLPEVIENAPVSRIRGYYDKWYRSDNMALVFVGDFDGAALEASLQNHFSIGKPNTPTNHSLHDVPPPKKNNTEVLILTDPEQTEINVSLYFKRNPEPVRGDLQFFRSEIMDILIEKMLSFRFTDAAVKPDTPYTNAYHYHMRFGQSSRFFCLEGDAKIGTSSTIVESTIEELLRVKESLVRYGFTEAELSLAASSIVSSLRRQVQEKDRQESERYVNKLTDYFLDGGNLADLEWELNALEQLLPQIKIKEINTLVKDYFAPGDLLVGVFAPDAEAGRLPSEEWIKTTVAQSSRMAVERPVMAAVEERLLFETPQRGFIVSESVDEETEAIIWELNNGAQIILKHTMNKNDEIFMSAKTRGGIMNAADEDHVSASLATEMMQVSGLGPWSLSELMRKNAAKQVSFSSWMGYYSRGLRCSSTVTDLKTLFEMVYLGFTYPRIDPEAVSAMMDQYASGLIYRDDDPDTFFFDEVSRLAFSNHPRLKPMEYADLEKADIDSAFAFASRAMNPSDYTFVFAGNIDTGVMRDLVETYIASIPRSESWNEWVDPKFVRPGKIDKAVYKGKEDKSWVFLGWYADHAYSSELSAIADVLGGYLDIVLNDEIREKLGGVYGIWPSVSAWPIPKDEILINVIFSCDPQRVEELCSAVIDELNKIAVQGSSGVIDQDIFDKSVEALHKEWETSIQNNSFIGESLVNSVVFFRDSLSGYLKLPAQYSSVTPNDIRNLCAQLILNDSNGPMRVVLYPGQ